MASKKLTEKELRKKGFLPSKKYEALSSKIGELEVKLAHTRAQLSMLDWQYPKTITHIEYSGIPKHLQERYALDVNCLEAFGTKVYNLIVYSSC